MYLFAIRYRSRLEPGSSSCLRVRVLKPCRAVTEAPLSTAAPVCLLADWTSTVKSRGALLRHSSQDDCVELGDLGGNPAQYCVKTANFLCSRLRRSRYTHFGGGLSYKIALELGDLGVKNYALCCENPNFLRSHLRRSRYIHGGGLLAKVR